MSEDEKTYTWIGFALGILVMAIIWTGAASSAEDWKVSKGWLRCRSKIYMVEIYDELATPEKP